MRREALESLALPMRELRKTLEKLSSSQQGEEGSMNEVTDAHEVEDRARSATLRELAKTTMSSVVLIGDPADVIRLADLQDD